MCVKINKIKLIRQNEAVLRKNLVITLVRSGPYVIKLSSCSIQLSMKWIMLINVKMPTIVGILTFSSMINTAHESLKVRIFFIFQHFSFMSS